MMISPRKLWGFNKKHDSFYLLVVSKELLKIAIYKDFLIEDGDFGFQQATPDE